MDGANCTPHDTLDSGRTDMVDAMLAASTTMEGIHFPLSRVAGRGETETVCRLLHAGAPVHDQSVLGERALENAVTFGLSTVVDVLLSAGAGVDRRDRHGNTALLRAAQHGHIHIVDELLLAGASVHAKNSIGFSALACALDARGVADAAVVIIIKKLLASGSDVEETISFRGTALSIAASSGQEDIVICLLAAGATFDTPNASGYTPLALAALEGHVAVANELLEMGAEVDHANRSGETALIHTARSGHAELVQLLLEKGANVDRASRWGDTALLDAARKGSRDDYEPGDRFVERPGASFVDVVHALLAAGANANSSGWQGETPLTLVSQFGHAETVTLLLSINAMTTSFHH